MNAIIPAIDLFEFNSANDNFDDISTRSLHFIIAGHSDKQKLCKKFIEFIITFKNQTQLELFVQFLNSLFYKGNSIEETNLLQDDIEQEQAKYKSMFANANTKFLHSILFIINIINNDIANDNSYLYQLHCKLASYIKPVVCNYLLSTINYMIEHHMSNKN